MSLRGKTVIEELENKYLLHLSCMYTNTTIQRFHNDTLILLQEQCINAHQ